MPIVGPLPAPGTYAVGALSGYGAMAACAAGELCVAWITDGSRPDYADFLSLRRYAVPAYRTIMAGLAESGEL